MINEHKGTDKAIRCDIQNDIKSILAYYTVSKEESSLLSRYPSIASEWSEKNDPLKPSMVNCGMNLRVYWTCKKCGKEWLSSIGNRTKGSGCPTCAMKKRKQCTSMKYVKVGENDVATLFPQLVNELIVIDT